ncbi:23S rRNA (pseudouridine(1915)-N(3))-methyltransferase RlmH [Alkalilimnicola ehrlichii]|uniref:Ribosomal RNA large subunit methyltransferase H n=1 Tax=Alkalilimnicola ehrlichii TaxID=351052 RepID=A0A3E0X0B5_9GAMM|nr:23S rRNA (pseudouridine(1915)-N(3))-methyltransferase RlmH [Alkalilimnicola ehrlichii]RFA30275.1 23S rRNA (pseudouridine(1915)-N(3))-methyltransferase RlmH [Alkalilimnicola ehrlichii]RFA37853.1 23S rRNA (pseudouridine(1915)-N(3))-methyltransferase RlmH [Alkalilimnicola ehrlichii]
MRMSVLSTGGRMPSWVSEGWQEYANRMPPNLPLQLVELSLAPRSKQGSTVKAQAQESQRMLKAIPSPAHVVALDPKGRSLTTEQMAERMEHWLQDGKEVVFLIGGPEGLSDECRARADEMWSLSKLTFPHMMVRVLLAEQLYRAWTIIQNHPYHR